MRKCLLLIFLLSSYLIAVESDKTTTISADEVEYDGTKVLLNGKVTLTNVMGVVKAKHAILQRDLLGTCKIDFPYLELFENVEATFSNQGTLFCEKVVCNYFTLKSHFTGTKELHYTDERGEIFAVEGIVEYAEIDNSIEPLKITLKGNVRLIHKAPASQYALADILEYYPKEEIIVLKGQEGGRVLFFDRAKGMQMSALEVRAKRGDTKGKEAIQGIGDVCFLFKEEELNKLKDRFQWNP
jgi:hypothetical protein